MAATKINIEDFAEFVYQYNTDLQYFSQRFGQAFINYFKIEAFEGSNEIFYKKNDTKVMDAIFKYKLMEE